MATLIIFFFRPTRMQTYNELFPHDGRRAKVYIGGEIADRRTLLRQLDALVREMQGWESQGKILRGQAGPDQPTVARKNGSSVGMRHALHARFFTRFGHRFCMLGRCLSTKISASELRRKFIRSALLVGEVLYVQQE